MFSLTVPRPLHSNLQSSLGIFGHLYDFLRYRKILILMILTTRFFKRNTSIHENKERYTGLIYIHIRWFKRINIETYGILIRRDFEIDGIFETDGILGDGILSYGILRLTGFLRLKGFWVTGFWDRRDFETDGILFDGILIPTGFWDQRDFETDGILWPTGFWDRWDFNWRDFETDGILRPTGFWDRRDFIWQNSSSGFLLF